ncbi:general secretion pathway protein GspH [Thiocapsa imhoffii]|uniref:General secretion pathway protein GspH n=1 Tax=Thiocapsa imhoffii TaxID=382777 RepID=A0A9X0WI96_9GAMM|nr:type II secretion system protein [Thiocapsa imhoffii]MBK1644995.1 general secretion pathway protein GspH [Thiocapsa imhoffii]
MIQLSTPRARERGFSLLEVLVAFAILAISLGVLMQIFTQASRATLISSQYSRAASLVESKLNAVGDEIPLEEGVVTGDPEGGIHWEIVIQSVELDELFGSEAAPITPFRVTATALWQDGAQVRRVTLSTLRLGAPF